MEAELVKSEWGGSFQAYAPPTPMFAPARISYHARTVLPEGRG
jgi:hypothetical protein